MNNLSFSKKVLFSFIALLIFAIILEFGIRLVLFFTHPGNRTLTPDAYEEVDPNFGWGLKPNYQNVLFSPDTGREELLIINSKGFRGKEFETEKKPGVSRIIAMGDSVTFGITPEACPYPAQLQELLDQKYPNQIEIINAGVEGYSSQYVLKRLQYDILQYQPDMIIVYAGWNDLYAVNPLSLMDSGQLTGLANFLNKFYLYKGSRKLIFQWLKPELASILNQNHPEIKTENAYQNFEPADYRNNLEQIVATAKNSQIRVVLVNLASILSDQMTEMDLQKVHYPYFTSGVKELKTLQARYNQTIKEVAQKEQVPLIDLDQVLSQRPNKGELFFDTMHLYCAGQKVIAETVLNSLISQKQLNLVQ